MIVCSCHCVTDRELRTAFGPGGHGRCLAGTGCGNCLPAVRDIVSRCGGGCGVGDGEPPCRDVQRAVAAHPAASSQLASSPVGSLPVAGCA